MSLIVSSEYDTRTFTNIDHVPQPATAESSSWSRDGEAIKLSWLTGHALDFPDFTGIAAIMADLFQEREHEMILAQGFEAYYIGRGNKTEAEHGSDCAITISDTSIAHFR